MAWTGSARGKRAGFVLSMLGAFALWCLPLFPAAKAPSQGWARHTIDRSSRGADGVRLADVNGDGLPDIATGWEEGGRVRVYLHPGPAGVKQNFPSVTVGEVATPEDAVLIDLDGDGATDVVSSCEGQTRTLFVHWAPTETKRYRDAGAWKTEPLPRSRGIRQWMFTLPFDVDGRYGVDLVAGAKNEDAQIGWFEAPKAPRDLEDWKWHPLYEAGWIMSLVAHDMDRDGDLDIVATDRKGSRRGALWLENPGTEGTARRWSEHRIGAVNAYEAMFLTIGDLDQDGLDDVLVAVRGGPLRYHRRVNAGSNDWETHSIPLPLNTGTGKGVGLGDIDLDGRMDLVFSCENATAGKSGVMWMSYRQAAIDAAWEAHPISGPEGVKFDRLELLDLDQDGDLDILTCEERDNLGVIWYENPIR